MRTRSLLSALAALLSLPLHAAAQGYICAEGGGNEQNGTWAPSVFGWMVEKGGFGDVLILGVNGADPAVAQTFLQQGAASATNLAVGAGSADLQSTYDQIVAADVIWMRGGDQSNYVNLWGGTKTEQAIRDVYQAGGVVGGTSAGCAVLGEVIYPAFAGSLTNNQALANPYHPNLSLIDDFLELTPGVLFDTHFTERGRLARMAVMLARWFEDTGEDVLAIGVDDRTALCVHPDLTAEVRGEAAVTILRRGNDSAQILKDAEPPVFTAIEHDQLTEGYVYDLVARQVIARPATATLVAPAGANPSFAASLSLQGSVEAQTNQGDFEVEDFNDDAALFLGRLQLLPGLDQAQRTIVETQAFVSTAFDENRVGGAQWALHENPHFLALYLNPSTTATALDASRLLIGEPAGVNDYAVCVLDSHGMISTARSTYLASPSSVDTRQSVALEGARLHLLRPGMVYDAQAHGTSLTWNFGSGLAGCSGPHVMGSSSSATLGDTSFQLTCAGAPPSTLGIGAFSVTPDLSGTDLGFGFPVHLGFAPFLPLQFPFPSDVAGQGTASFPIPADPTLAGRTFYTQALWPWLSGPCLPSGLGLSASPGFAFTVLP